MTFNRMVINSAVILCSMLILTGAAEDVTQLKDLMANKLEISHTRGGARRLKGPGGGRGGGGGGGDPPADPPSVQIAVEGSISTLSYGDAVNIKFTEEGPLNLGSRSNEEIKLQMDIYDVNDSSIKYTTKQLRFLQLVTEADGFSRGYGTFYLNALNAMPVKWPGSWNVAECTTGAGCDDCDCLACFGCDPDEAFVQIKVLLTYTEKIKGQTYLRSVDLGEGSKISFTTNAGVTDPSKCYCNNDVDICNGANGCSTSSSNWYNNQPVSSVYPVCMTPQWGGTGEHTNPYRCTYGYHDGCDPRIGQC